MLIYELCGVGFSFNHVAFFLSGYVEQKTNFTVVDTHVSVVVAVSCYLKTETCKFTYKPFIQ